MAFKDFLKDNENILRLVLSLVVLIGGAIVALNLGTRLTSADTTPDELILFQGRIEVVPGSKMWVMYGGICPDTNFGVLNQGRSGGYSGTSYGWMPVSEGYTVYLSDITYTVVSVDAEKIVLHKEVEA